MLERTHPMVVLIQGNRLARQHRDATLDQVLTRVHVLWKFGQKGQ